MDIHEIMVNSNPGRFKAFLDSVIEQYSESERPEPLYEKFSDLLLKTAWAARRVAELDERLEAEVYGLALETPLEMIRILRAK